ncbi:hypothetical protein HYY75_12870 [bacterium]|nr:hypothetical protein [bacterium]
MFGRDPLAIDTTAARIMGFEPYNIPYFNAASWSFPGFTESSIVYKGEHPKRYATKFSCLPALANLQGGPFW